MTGPHGEHVGHAVADQHHRDAAVAQVADQVEHLATCRTEIAAVGSSISTILASDSMVRAIATAAAGRPTSA